MPWFRRAPWDEDTRAVPLDRLPDVLEAAIRVTGLDATGWGSAETLKARVGKAAPVCHNNAMRTMIPVEEARAALLAALPPRRTGLVPLHDALGRVLAEDVLAAEDIPAFERAVMDGYAVRSADVSLASLHNGVALAIAGAAMAGESAPPAVGPGRAVAVATGAPLPPGADAVVRLEDTKAEGDRVVVYRAVKPKENTDPAGSDIAAGDLALPAGTVIGPAAIGVLASLGRAHVPVVLPPRIACIPTGDEVVPFDSVPGYGQVRNSTTPLLAALFRQWGAEPRLYPQVDDRAEAIAAALQAARRDDPDVLVTSGGVSVGPRDLLRDVLTELGAEILFWRVAIKPGKNVVAARWGDALVLALSGNPAAAMITAQTVARPALLALAGREPSPPPVVQAVVEDGFCKTGGVRRMLRARVWRCGNGFRARLAGSQLGSRLASFTAANAILDIPAGTRELRAGSVVSAMLLEGAAEELLDGWPGTARGEERKTPIVCIVGPSDTGKTTLIERLLPELIVRGLRVATVKHHHVAEGVDVPGKDTWRHRRAGAAATLLAAPGQTALFRGVEGELAPEEAAALAGQDADLVLVEGYKRAALPKIEVRRPGDERPWLCAGDPDLVAVVADEAAMAPEGVPRFGWDQIHALADRIVEFCLPVG